MNIKDIISLATRGVKPDQLKELSTNENRDAMIELLKSGIGFDEAKDLVALADEKPDDSVNTPSTESKEEEPTVNEWEVKYKELLRKSQLENSRKDNSDNEGEEAERKKHLLDSIRSFM